MPHTLMSAPTSHPVPRHPDALVLMAKDPAPGRVKTRLCPPLTPEESAALYRAFLEDLGRELRAWPAEVDRFVAWSGDTDSTLRSLLGEGFHWIEQRGDDLTARMEDVFTRLQAAGYRRVVMRNTDSPHLPLSWLERAFDALGGGVVLGPDLDGGYYLVGLDVPPDGVFPRAMSHASVLEQTRENARALGHAVAELESFLDVDDADDLLTFWVEFGGRADVTHWATWRFLDGHPLLDRLRSSP